MHFALVCKFTRTSGIASLSDELTPVCVTWEKKERERERERENSGSVARIYFPHPSLGTCLNASAGVGRIDAGDIVLEQMALH